MGGIDRDNAVSIRLHERLGFRFVGTFREVGRKNDLYARAELAKRMLHLPTFVLRGMQTSANWTNDTELDTLLTVLEQR